MRRMMVTMTAGLALVLAGCPEEPAQEAQEPQEEVGETAVTRPPGVDAGPAAADAAEGGEASSAVAELEGRSGREVAGTATFTAEGGEVRLVVDVTRAPPGTHAIHLHETGDCSAEDASSAGDHWNPTRQQHGQWGQDGHHLGDIGNLEVGQDGTARLSFSTDQWALGGGGERDVVGKAVVIHVDPDDFQPPAGNAGARIACGVVEEAPQEKK